MVRFPEQAPVVGETLTTTVLEYPDGLQALIAMNHYDQHGTPNGTFTFLGTMGALEGTIGQLYDLPDTLTLRRSGMSPVAYGFDRRWFPDAFLGPMSDLMDAIVTSRTPKSSGRDNCTRSPWSSVPIAPQQNVAASPSRACLAREDRAGHSALVGRKPGHELAMPSGRMRLAISASYAARSPVSRRASSMTETLIGVTTWPGQTSYTRTPSLARFARSTMARPCTPPLLEPYAYDKLPPLTPAPDAVSTITRPRGPASVARRVETRKEPFNSRR